MNSEVPISACDAPRAEMGEPGGGLDQSGRWCVMGRVINLVPKGSAWLVLYRRYADGGRTTFWAFVFNRTGLTAYEAWERANLPHNPAYYECTLELLSEPSMSANTQSLSDRAKEAFERLKERSVR